jgi:hypothetical protein
MSVPPITLTGMGEPKICGAGGRQPLNAAV